jgi:hypothetical protein
MTWTSPASDFAAGLHVVSVQHRQTTDARSDDRRGRRAILKPTALGIEAMTIDQRQTADPLGEDRQLVDLLATVLTDPNIHTDTRMRLREEITEILAGAHEDLHGAAGRELHRRAVESHGGRLPDVLASVLVDPNLHTDMRMRLCVEIGEILASVPEWDRCHSDAAPRN